MKLSLENLLKELDKIESLEKLEEFYKKYLWKKWLIAQQFKTLGKLSPEERKEKWQFLSKLKENLEKHFKNKQSQIKTKQINKNLSKEIIEITTPAPKLEIWHYNLIAKERRRIEDIFKWLWFAIEYWHDIVSKYENFFSLNIPPTHPATEMHDTFYIKEKDKTWENLVLRTHTSAMQNNIMKKYSLPIKVIIPGKVYRYENTDASHDTVFWQVEWLVIDKNLSLRNFKYLMNEVLNAIFESKVKIRMRPAYFPFVEPGFEIDASCPICKGEGCSLCKKTWWIEILGAWMFHPNVLKQWWIIDKHINWFAFWLWLTRLIAIKYWIKDIRLFTNWDLRFVKSFN